MPLKLVRIAVHLERGVLCEQVLGASLRYLRITSSMTDRESETATKCEAAQTAVFPAKSQCKYKHELQNAVTNTSVEQRTQ